MTRWGGFVPGLNRELNVALSATVCGVKGEVEEESVCS